LRDYIYIFQNFKTASVRTMHISRRRRELHVFGAENKYFSTTVLCFAR
jgi:hypothetical protein